jgi:hypothetical protein
VSRLRYEYGAGPLHLVAAVLGLGVAVWALAMAVGMLGRPENFVKWFVGAILLHDVLFLPAYSALGLAASGALVRGRPTPLRVAALNHLRVPALLSGLMLLVWYPLVLGTQAASFRASTGYSSDFFLGRWVALTAVLFGASALIFALRARSLGAKG